MSGNTSACNITPAYYEEASEASVLHLIGLKFQKKSKCAPAIDKRKII